MTEIVAVTAVPSRQEYSEPRSVEPFLQLDRTSTRKLSIYAASSINRVLFLRPQSRASAVSICSVIADGCTKDTVLRCAWFGRRVNVLNVHNEPVSEEKKSPKCVPVIFKDEKCLCGSAKIWGQIRLEQVFNFTFKHAVGLFGTYKKRTCSCICVQHRLVSKLTCIIVQYSTTTNKMKQLGWKKWEKTHLSSLGEDFKVFKNLHW